MNHFLMGIMVVLTLVALLSLYGVVMNAITRWTWFFSCLGICIASCGTIYLIWKKFDVLSYLKEGAVE